MTLNEIRLAITDFLNIPIIVNQIISIDFWSIVHLFTGGLILFLIVKFLKNKSSRYHFITLLILLSVWEVFELTNYAILKNNLFIPETLTNIIWDLIMGMSGGILTFIISKRK